MKTILLATGSVFHDLTVIERYAPITRGKRVRPSYLCRCVCGNTTVVSTDKLKSGNTKSCGCRKTRIKANYRHGGCGTRLYVLWGGIKARCQNPKNSHYDQYGGSGITLCADWQKFPKFKEWAYANGYKDTLSIERKDPFGNYCPENCTWIPFSQQQNNKKKSRKIKAFKRTKTLANWALDPRCSVCSSSIAYRIDKLGWSPEKAISAPSRYAKS